MGGETNHWENHQILLLTSTTESKMPDSDWISTELKSRHSCFLVSVWFRHLCTACSPPWWILEITTPKRKQPVKVTTNCISAGFHLWVRLLTGSHHHLCIWLEALCVFSRTHIPPTPLQFTSQARKAVHYMIRPGPLGKEINILRHKRKISR